MDSYSTVSILFILVREKFFSIDGLFVCRSPLQRVSSHTICEDGDIHVGTEELLKYQKYICKNKYVIINKYELTLYSKLFILFTFLSISAASALHARHHARSSSSRSLK